MNVSLYQAAAAMNANERWQDMITENLATTSAPGSRKQEISFADVAAGRVPGSAGAAGAQYFMPTAHTSINFQQGEMAPTGNATDFAIDGRAFFEVQLPNGKKAYTRDGEFQINAQNQLVTKQGYLVMSDNGPVQLDPNNSSPITVSANGDISQGDRSQGHLRLVEYPDVNKLSALGAGLFVANKPGIAPLPTTTSMVRQGYLEESNTTPTMQMSSLITSMRMFEADQKVITMQDDRMGKTISDLSGTS